MTNSSTCLPYISRSVDQDIDEYRASLKVLSPAIRQLSKGSFVGSSVRIHLPDITLIRRSTSARYMSTCWVPAEATFLFPLDERETLVRGRLLGADQQIGSLGNHEASIVFPADFSHLFVTVPLHALPRYLDASETALFLDALAAIESGPVDASAKRAVTARLSGMFNAIESSSEPLAPAMLAEYCQTIVNVLFDYLLYHRRAGALPAGNHEKILQRALALFEARPTHAFSLEELAREVFASKRAVQYAFANILGLSPMRFQKLHRLNLVRDDLKAASTAPFASIIARYSFSNSSRLCSEYSEFFGEHPRTTRLRCRPGCNNTGS